MAESMQSLDQLSQLKPYYEDLMAKYLPATLKL